MNELTTPIAENYEDLLDRDSHAVPAILRDVGDRDTGPTEVPTSWYLDPEIHKLEVEQIWKKTWQMACREDDIPEVGDTWVYDVATLSYIIVRTRGGKIKAYHNSCLHRGRALRDCPGRVTHLRCPFHGFMWDLDGNLREVPAHDEFPEITEGEFKLPEAQVSLWGGFVFINPDLNASPLILDRLTDEFARWPLDERAKVAHVSKVLPTNWKVLQDAFSEAFHVEATHPQLILGFGEQYRRMDAFGIFARSILGSFTTSGRVAWKPTKQQVFTATIGLFEDQPAPIQIDEDTPIRETVATMSREKHRPTLGDEVDKYCDAEMVDVISYSVFPNLDLFAGFTSPVVYSFRPNGNDHLSSIMDVMVLAPCPPGARPPAAKERRLREDQLFSDAPELGTLAPVLNQDIANLDAMNRGLINNKRGKLVLAKYHELKIRNFYKNYIHQMGL